MDNSRTTTDALEWIVRGRSNKDRRTNQPDRKVKNRGVGRLVDNSTMKAKNSRSPCSKPRNKNTRRST